MEFTSLLRVDACEAPLFRAAADTARAALCLQMDMIRTGYAFAVALGLAKRSILGSRDVERLADAMKQFTLGPLARRI